MRVRHRSFESRRPAGVGARAHNEEADTDCDGYDRSDGDPNVRGRDTKLARGRRPRLDVALLLLILLLVLETLDAQVRTRDAGRLDIKLRVVLGLGRGDER